MGAGGSKERGHLWLYGELKARLGSVRPCLKNIEKRKRRSQRREKKRERGERRGARGREGERRTGELHTGELLPVAYCQAFKREGQTFHKNTSLNLISPNRWASFSTKMS